MLTQNMALNLTSMQQGDLTPANFIRTSFESRKTTSEVTINKFELQKGKAFQSQLESTL